MIAIVGYTGDPLQVVYNYEAFGNQPVIFYPADRDEIDMRADEEE